MAISKQKQSITPEALCYGLPLPFIDFVLHISSLGFNEKPNYYHYLHTILVQCVNSISSRSVPFLVDALAKHAIAHVSAILLPFSLTLNMLAGQSLLFTS